MLRLQRLAGNTTVTRTIIAMRLPDDDRPADDAATPTEQPSPTHPATRQSTGTLAASVQRKVGFEFESGAWSPWRHLRAQRPGARQVPGPASGATDRVQPVPRKAVLENGNHFTLEADDSGGPTRSNLEFVTAPVDETMDGLRDLEQAFTGMLEIAHHLEEVRGRPGPGTTTGSPPYRISADSLDIDFVRPAEHRLRGSSSISGRDLLLSGGEPGFVVKMQSTAGLPLADIPAMMERLGPVPDESRADKTARTPYRETVRSSRVTSTKNLRIIGAAPSVASTAIRGLGRHTRYAAALAGDTRDLAGFLAALVACAAQLSKPGQPGKWGFEVVKTRLGMLHRNNFAQMFAALPPDQRVAIRSDPDVLIDSLLSAADDLLPVDLDRDDPMIPSHPDAPRPALASVTVAEWIKGITIGYDHLSQGGMARWLATKPAFTTADKESATEALESIGTQPAPDRRGPGAEKLFLFENRAIRPGIRMSGGRPEAFSLPMVDAVTNALEIFRLYKRLRDGALR
jgi:hypothetical protein